MRLNSTEGKKCARARGITMVELIIALVCSIIVILAIGVALADSSRGWQKMYGKIHADIIEDGRVAQRRFDAVMRKASSTGVLVAEDGSSTEVRYYASSSSVGLDRYVKFFLSDGELMLEDGVLSPKATTSVQTICANVTACAFKHLGKGVQMTLTLSDGQNTNTAVTSAYAHN
jgi:Tfp pilus assembly protein PilW